jgi:hypothetical protein
LFSRPAITAAFDIHRSSMGAQADYADFDLIPRIQRFNKQHVVQRQRLKMGIASANVKHGRGRKAGERRPFVNSVQFRPRSALPLGNSTAMRDLMNEPDWQTSYD